MKAKIVQLWFQRMELTSAGRVFLQLLASEQSFVVKQQKLSG